MLKRLPGFRECYPEACAIRNHLIRVGRQIALQFGFQEINTPILEPLELYTEKSGEEIVHQLFTFTDQGGRRVALRPEMTPRVAVMVGARAESLPKPIKLFSIGEHFRCERPQKGRLRSFCQLNADIFGEAGSGADAEMIAFTLQVLVALGLTKEDCVVRLSDRELWLAYLEQKGVSPAAASTVLQIVDKWERESREQQLERLRVPLQDKAVSFLSELDALITIRSLEELRGFLCKGQGTSEKIEARLGAWELLLADLEAMGWGPFIRIDLGIVRGLPYYTGFVFELFERREASRALAGGGRYDHLIQTLGGPEVPAVGVGIGDVTLTELLQKTKKLPGYRPYIDVYLITGGKAERHVALHDAVLMRQQGVRVEYPLKELPLKKQFKLADQRDARFAFLYGAEELDRQMLKVREMATGKETLHPHHDLVSNVRHRLKITPSAS